MIDRDDLVALNTYYGVCVHYFFVTFHYFTQHLHHDFMIFTVYDALLNYSTVYYRVNQALNYSIKVAM